MYEAMGFRAKAAVPFDAALFAGGATAVYVVTDASGAPAVNVLVTSSNPNVVKVSGPTDAKGEVTLTSGIEGEAQISVPNPRTRPDQFKVVVDSTRSLVLDGNYRGSAPAIVAGETVSLMVVGIANTSISRLFGSGKVTFSVEGTLTLQQGTPTDGEARVYFSGTPGKGKVLATDGTQKFELPITVVRNDTLGFNHTVSVSGGKQVIRFELNSPDTDSPGLPVLGGRCVWTGLDPSAFNDHTNIDSIGGLADRSVAVTLPETGDVTVTCRIGQTSKPIVLR